MDSYCTNNINILCVDSKRMSQSSWLRAQERYAGAPQLISTISLHRGNLIYERRNMSCCSHAGAPQLHCEYLKYERRNMSCCCHADSNFISERSNIVKSWRTMIDRMMDIWKDTACNDLLKSQYGAYDYDDEEDDDDEEEDDDEDDNDINIDNDDFSVL